MADCSYWEYQTSLALDGELSPGANDEMFRHLAECPHCRLVKDAFEKSAQVLRALPDLADPDLLAGLEHDIIQKTYRTRRKLNGRLLWPAAALLVAFTAANLWLGPLWQRPALLAAAVAQGNRLELTFNQPMDGTSWPETVTKTGITAGPEYAPRVGSSSPAAPLSLQATANSLAGPEFGPARGGPATSANPALPQTAQSLPAPAAGGSSAIKHSDDLAPSHPLTGPTRTFSAVAPPAAAPPYTVTRQGNTIVVSFAGPLPQGPVQILIPASVRDRWGRPLGQAYLIVIDHGKITIKSP
ncbi:MAG TPA: zf-HC2 domain-containing protein [Spirochaetia bacterium]|nr:zf-HC2 domain-containing protein [Spirochaetia bacterium]